MDLMNPLEETPKHKTDSLNPSLSNEDIFLMKQIERDSSYTFQVNFDYKKFVKKLSKTFLKFSSNSNHHFWFSY